MKKLIPIPPPTPPLKHKSPLSLFPNNNTNNYKPISNLINNNSNNNNNNNDYKWVSLSLPISELCLPLTLPTGQTFRFKQTGPAQYTGPIGPFLFSLITLHNSHIAYYLHNTTTNNNNNNNDNTCSINDEILCSKKKLLDIENDNDDEKISCGEKKLLDFLNIEISLKRLNEEFSKKDKRFKELSKVFGGVRVLRQDPMECLFGFICSSNNNITRITKMVDYLSSLGMFLGEVGGVEFYEFPSLERLGRVTESELREAGFGYREYLFGFICLSNNNITRITKIVDYLSGLGEYLGEVGWVKFYEFPSLESLGDVTEAELREAGFGAKYIIGTVDALRSKPEGGAAWLASLRKTDLQTAIDALCTLPGVGPKVAACVALFSLDQHHAIPVDTHVWKIATRYLVPELAGASLTQRLCVRVADAFVSRYGKYAGWAQTLLFIAELPSQKALLPSNLSVIEGEKTVKRKGEQGNGKQKKMQKAPLPSNLIIIEGEKPVKRKGGLGNGGSRARKLVKE